MLLNFEFEILYFGMKISSAVLLTIVLLAGPLLSSPESEVQAFLANPVRHVCQHDKIAKGKEILTDPPYKPDPAHFSASHLSAEAKPYESPDFVTEGWHPIRIGLEWSIAEKFIQSESSATIQARYQLSAKLIQSVRIYFQAVLQVNSYPVYVFKGGLCGELSVPAFTKYVDLTIVVNPENKPTAPYFAAAYSCRRSAMDLRTTMGAYILNLAPMSDQVIHSYLYFSTFAHEFTHILGFSSNLFPLFRNPQTGSFYESPQVKTATIGGKKDINFQMLILPEVVNYARKYFGCPTIEGIPLEDDGGDGSAGSHWEKTFLPHEYMNPSVENPGVISEFTFALLRGTGWYKTLPGGAQRFDWGKGSGCGYFHICPPAHQGTCPEGSLQSIVCSADYDARAICYNGLQFETGCPRKHSLEHSCLLEPGKDEKLLPNEQYGAYSRCFVWQAKAEPHESKPRCHKTICKTTTSKSSTGEDITVPVIQLQLGSKIVECTTSGQEITDLETDFKLVCPDLKDFCEEILARCPEDCNGRGMCTESRMCICNFGFTGPSCASADPKGTQPFAS